MKITVDENIAFAGEAFGFFGEVETVKGRDLRNDDLLDTDILIIRSVTKVNESLLKDTKVKFVGTATIGTDHIDTGYLQKEGVEFASAPGCNSFAVTEYVFSAIFHLANLYQLDLENISIGIIGVGNIGSKVATFAEVLGWKTVLNDPPLQRETGDNIYSSLEDALQCDIVTFHVPLNKGGTDNTIHLLNKENLSLIKEDAILINASRGLVVDNYALMEKLQNKNDIHTVLDVWENEPELSLELLSLVDIATPHIAGYTLEGKVNGTVMLFNALKNYLNKNAIWVPKMPKPENNILSIEFAEWDQAFYKLFNEIYPINEDSNRMKNIMMNTEFSKSDNFDKLRKNYPLRREINNYSAEIHCPKTVSLLRKFRLNII